MGDRRWPADRLHRRLRRRRHALDGRRRPVAEVLAGDLSRGSLSSEYGYAQRRGPPGIVTLHKTSRVRDQPPSRRDHAPARVVPSPSAARAAPSDSPPPRHRTGHSRHRRQVRSQSRPPPGRATRRGDVPGRKTELPEAIEAPGCDVGEVQRGGSATPDLDRSRYQRLQGREIRIESVQLAKHESAAEQGALQVALRRHPDPPVVEPCSRAARSREQLLPQRGRRRPRAPACPDDAPRSTPRHEDTHA